MFKQCSQFTQSTKTDMTLKKYSILDTRIIYIQKQGKLSTAML